MKVRFASPLVAAMLFAVTCVAYADSSPATAPVLPSGTHTVEDFLRRPAFSAMTLSPNGTYIAALMPIPDQPYQNDLVILDAKTAKVAHVVPAGKDASVTSYKWVTDTRLVATTVTKVPVEDTPTDTGKVFAVNVDGSHQKALVDGALMDNVPLDEYRILTISENFQMSRVVDRDGASTSVSTVDVANANTLTIATSPVHNAELIADNASQVRAAYADNVYTGGKLWLRANNDAPWALMNDTDKSGVAITPVGFNRDNTKLYVRVSSGNKPDAIDALDMATQKLTLVYQGQFADPGEMIRSADQKDYYAIITRDGKNGIFYLDENSVEARLNQALSANFPGQLVYFSSFTRDGKQAVMHVSADRNPGDFYLFDFDTHNARYLLSAMPWVDPRTMRPMEPMTVTTRDGVTVHGFLTTPQGNKPYPLIVLPHGGPHGIYDSWGYDPEVQLFASHGYAVLQLNYRGSGGYGLAFQKKGYRQWGLSMQDDLTDATKWAVDQGYTDPRRICIYGGSYGGYAALEGAVREPDLYKCAIGYAGVYDLRIQWDESDTQFTEMGQDYLTLVLGKDRDDLLKRSPLGGVERIKANVLLVHGGDDPRVPIDNFKEFTHAMDKDGKHYETLVEPHEGHGFYLPAHRVEAYQKMLEFLDANIGSSTKGNPSTTASQTSSSNH